jgi:hypothetical protein
MMRLGISEARRFPELATSVRRMAQQRSEETIRRVLGEVAQTNERYALPAFRPEQLAATTHVFVDLVVMPLVVRATHSHPEPRGERGPAPVHRLVGGRLTLQQSIPFLGSRAGQAPR